MTTIQALLATCAATFTMAACSTAQAIPQAPQAVQAQRVGLEVASRRALRYSAVVAPEAEVVLGFRVPGYVVAVRQVRGDDGRLRDIAEGDRVRAGTVLVRLRADEYEDRAGQARAQAAVVEAMAQKARLDFDRATRLYATHSVTLPDLEAAQAQFDATRSQLQAARAALSEAEIAHRDTTLTAPFDAVIVRKTVERGAFAGPGTPVLALARTEVVKFVIGVPDTTLRAIALGQRVDVTVDAFADRTFQARVSRIAAAADARTRNFEVEIAVPNRDQALKVGMIGSLHLAVGDGEAPPPSLRVPLSAMVKETHGGYGVFTIEGSPHGQTARLRPVEVGPVTGSDISIVSGLRDGDEVITVGANLLKDGQRVEVVK